MENNIYEANQTPGVNRAYSLSTPKKTLTGWTTFWGIFNIIIGALSCLSIIGAAIGVFQIIAGLKLLKAVEITKSPSYSSSDSDQVLEQLNSFFKINGIILIVSFVLVILSFIVIMAVGLSMLNLMQ
ncbi:MAG TPA: DUF5362 family protein [Bacillota bacterium]|nr:DUF5362 family protein [Bacillota bacterium]HOL09166.1 DUF5362 family protein [Bacillota bacterium]HPO96841.1 DUF5362 family protein [Bacillota bacterium]